MSNTADETRCRWPDCTCYGPQAPNECRRALPSAPAVEDGATKGDIDRWRAAIPAAAKAMASHLDVASSIASSSPVEGVERELVELLLERYTAEPIPPCRVCGAALTVQSAGGGHATEYACTAAGYAPGWIEHYDASRFRHVRPGDEDVLSLISAISRLVKERDEALDAARFDRATFQGAQRLQREYKARAEAAEASVARLTALLAEADEVVKPFAKGPVWDHIDDDAPLTRTAERGVRISAGHLRAARRYQQKREAK
jgi:hypothetical protein